MDKVVTSEVLVGGDFNGHVVNDMGSFGEAHDSFGIGRIYDGGGGGQIDGLGSW